MNRTRLMSHHGIVMSTAAGLSTNQVPAVVGRSGVVALLEA